MRASFSSEVLYGFRDEKENLAGRWEQEACSIFFVGIVLK